MHCLHLGATGLLLLLLATPAVAQTLVVDAANGPGATHTTIEGAIAAAPSGATIEVRRAQYVESSLTISGKALAVLCEPGTEILLPPGVPLRIEATAPTQRVLMREFGLRETQGGVVEIQCDGCQGRVVLEGIWDVTHSRMLRATNCDQLVASSCSFQGGGVRSTDSRLVLELCAVVSYAPVVFLQTGGTVQLSDTTVMGQVGFQPPNTAYSLQGGEVRVSGDSSVTGGIQLPFNRLGVSFVGQGSVRVDPRASLDWQFPTTISVATMPMPNVTTSAVVQVTGRVVTELHGPIGHLGLLAIGAPGPVTAVPPLADPVWFQPGSALVQAIGTPSTMGPLTTVTTIPATPSLRGVTVVWHGFTYEASAGLQVSNPSVRVVY